MNQQTVIYFAYGSNMSRARLEVRVGSVHVLGPGRAVDRGHSFSKLGRDGTGKGNIRPSPGDVVYGVLYRLSGAQMDMLRGFEGGYRQISLSVTRGVGDAAAHESVPVRTFEALRPVTPLRPTREYIEHYAQGIREHGLPAAYEAFVRAQAALDAPAAFTAFLRRTGT